MLPPPPPPASPQHRGSLHAHILLWVDPADAAKVAQEITATRCNYAPDHDAPGPAGCPWRDDVHLSGTNDLQQMTTEERLHRLVQRKQIHTCRAGPLGCCRGDRPCRYGFPFPPNLDGTYLEAKSGRCAALHPCRVQWPPLSLWRRACAAMPTNTIARRRPSIAGTSIRASAHWTRWSCPTTRPSCWRGAPT
jgi:hypothetical protein